MTTPQMHVWFRQYAQQMGIQNVRAILPEQIDLVINTSIMDTVNRIVQENIALTNDRVITDNSKLGQINALRTLYRTATIQFDKVKNGVTFPKPNALVGKLIIKISDGTTGEQLIPGLMFIDDFSLSYKQANPNEGLHVGDRPFSEYAKENNFETLPYPVRLIENRYLADTLNDFVLKPTLRSPIIVLHKKDDYTSYDLYIDKFVKTLDSQGQEIYTLKHGLLPYEFTINYVAKPREVVYNEDMPTNSVDSDMPEYMHVEILKHAVDLWRISVAGSLQSTQAQQQAQQQENMRNNYRNDGNRQ